MLHAGQVLEREQLFRRVWKTDYVEDTRTLDVHISWLQKKIEDDPRSGIQTGRLRVPGRVKDLGRHHQSPPLHAPYELRTGVPANLEPCIERRYFSGLQSLALTCDDDVLIQRLQQRPAWRQTHSIEHQYEHVRFNQWFKTQARRLRPGIDLIDTTGVPVVKTVEQVAPWIRAKIAS